MGSTKGVDVGSEELGPRSALRSADPLEEVLLPGRERLIEGVHQQQRTLVGLQLLVVLRVVPMTVVDDGEEGSRRVGPVRGAAVKGTWIGYDHVAGLEKQRLERYTS